MKEVRARGIGCRGAAAALALVLAAAFAALAPAPALAAEGGAAMHRLYNSYTGEHFYTRDASEKDGLVAVGWTYEGVGWTAPASGEAVYRLYNPYAPGGDHHYTLSEQERDALVAVGWRDEGVGWRSEDPSVGVPLYRQYNPYAVTGTHNYTTSKDENDQLVSVGWRAEGVAWYGAETPVGGSGGGLYEYELLDDVEEVEEYDGGDDGEFELSASNDVPKVGDKVLLQPTDENPLGAAGTVTSVTTAADGSVSVEFDQASDPAEVFEWIEMSDEGVAVDPDRVVEDSVHTEIRPPFGVDDMYGSSGTWEPEEGALGDDFNIKLNDDGSSYVKGGVSVKPKVGYDVKWSLFGGLERCELSVGGGVEIEAEAHVQNGKEGRDIRLFEVSTPLPYGFSIDVPFYIHVQADGSISVDVAYEMMTTAKLVNGEWVVEDESDLDADMSAAVHLRLGAKVGAELKLLSVQLVDAAVGAGADGTFETTLHETGLQCVDLSAYLYVSVEVGKGTDYLVKLGLTFGRDVIDESNSPVRLAWHFENGVRVPECTYGRGENDPAAFADVVRQYESTYGTLSFQDSGHSLLYTGVFLADFVDFDDDGTDELVIGYSEPFPGGTQDCKWPSLDVWELRDGIPTRVYQGATVQQSDIGRHCEYVSIDGTWYLVVGWEGGFADLDLMTLRDGSFETGISMRYEEIMSGAMVTDVKFYINDDEVSISEYSALDQEIHSGNSYKGGLYEYDGDPQTAAREMVEALNESRTKMGLEEIRPQF